jgi:hypothetical protein
MSIWFLVVIFVLSLGLHNHAFYFGSSLPDGAYKTDSGRPGHSNELCSACRLSGNLRQTNNLIDVASNEFSQLAAYANTDLLIPSSYYCFNYSPRSPPIA